MIRVVPLSRALLLISAVAGAVAVLGALFSDGQLAAQGGLAALVSLGAYVAAAGRASAPGTRWALAAGIGILAVGMALRLHWYTEPTEDFRWIAPFYAPLNGGAAQMGRPDAAVLDLWRQTIDQERIVAILHLLAVLSFAVCVFGLPRVRRPGRMALTATLAMLLLVVVGVNVSDRLDGSAVLDQLATVGPALLATLVAIGLIAVAGRRADHARLIPSGTLLVALATAAAFDDLAGAWSAWWTLSQITESEVMVGISVAVGGSPMVIEAVTAAGALAGPALLAIGALRASRVD